MKWIKKWIIKSFTDPERYYIVSQDKNGNFGCSCPEWKFRRNECKHIIAVKNNPEDNLLDNMPEEIKEREAQPGNVGEVSIKKEKDLVLYPLVELPPDPHFVATIIYDLIRANVKKEIIKHYKNCLFPKTSLKKIIKYVKENGRKVKEKWIDGEGWIGFKILNPDTPIKEI